MKWAPQQDILAHPKTLAFFTHGGLKSIKESICGNNVPMLILPFFADQTRNANSFVLRGIAESIHKLRITSEEIVEKLRKLLDHPGYRNCARKLNEKYQDNLVDALDHGVFQVEKVGRLMLAESANVIFFEFFGSKSHALTMLPLAERLAKDHNVTLFTITIRSLDIKSERVTILETFIEPDARTLTDEMIGRVFWFSEMRPWRTSYLYEVGLNFLEKSLEDAVLKGVLATPFDIAIVDESYTSLQGTIALKLRERFGTKIVAFATTEMMPVASSLRSFNRNPIIMPNTFLSCSEVYSKHETFPERIKTFIDYSVDILFSEVIASRISKRAGNLLGLPDSSKIQFFQKTLITLNDYPEQFSVTSPKAHDMFQIGSHCSSKTSQNLPQEFQDFIEDPKSRGTIYVAFGSYANLDSGPSGTIEKFKDALNQFRNYRVIWSYKGNNTENILEHVKIMKWAPQQDILAHPKTLAFFTHGGLKSMKEGICGKVPMLFLPFYGDQTRNANAFVLRGIAESIHKLRITSEEIVEKLRKLLDHPGYRNSARRLNEKYLDNPMNPLDFGAFQVEKLVQVTMPDDIPKIPRHRGKKNEPKNTPWKQQNLPALRPHYSITSAIPVTGFFGLATLIMGIALYFGHQRSLEQEVIYTNCAQINATASDQNTICSYTITLDEKYEGDVKFYYGLTNFYQNNRLYFNSRNDQQLRGDVRETDGCDPLEYVLVNETKVPIAPCGMVADSMFNDTFNLFYITDNKTITKVAWTTRGVLGATEMKRKFRNPPRTGNQTLCDVFNNTMPPPSWRVPICQLGLNSSDADVGLGFENIDFMVWMKIAALPRFRKLYRVLNRQVDMFSDGLPAGNYNLVINYHYPVDSFNGDKSFVIARENWVGPRNLFLPVIYLVVGTFLLLVTILFILIWLKQKLSRVHPN
ncbi:unnamed protein product [Caenorhabditis angaria]|uniref:glucuronosyltransferase n=1 Tax=Caenorhabditis angaria TaxID=860376 RepID=A0A9P1N3G6_9PELO|nr:unnamed protein product [Caenorhabditis angaria]